MPDLREALSHVYWIGGAPDSGKTSVAALLAARHGMRLYDYDRYDVAHHERLARHSAAYAGFMGASLEERWVRPEPDDLLQRSLRSFHNRWPFVIEDLLELPPGGPVLAEGFGLTPELVAPVLADKRRGFWLVPTESFKRASMARRDKPAWRFETSDPERAFDNLLRRDLLLAAHLRRQAGEVGLDVCEVDGSRSPEQLAALLEQRFEL